MEQPIAHDILRPASPEAARRVVEAVAPNEHDLLKTDFYTALCAAFMIEEVAGQLLECGLPLEVTRVSDRHMVIAGMLR